MGYARGPKFAPAMAAFCARPIPVAPEVLTRAEVAKLSTAGQEDYERRRLRWHKDLPTFRTAKMGGVLDDLWAVHDRNPEDPFSLKEAASLDADSGVGKTTTALQFQREVWRQELADHGCTTETGDQRVPTFNVELSGSTTPRDVNHFLLRYYQHPAMKLSHLPSETRAADMARELMVQCGTVLGVIDEVHFIHPDTLKGTVVGNHLKYLMDVLGITLVFVGVDLIGAGFYDDQQIRNRTTPLSLPTFSLQLEQIRDWDDLLRSTEGAVRLLDAEPGMLTSMSAYIFSRTKGYFSSYVPLISGGCQRAIRSGQERLTVELLDNIKVPEPDPQRRPRHRARARR